MNPNILIPLILFLGIITSYEDVRYGKIRNKWLFLALLGLFVYYVLNFSFPSQFHPYNYYLLALANLGGAFAFGLVLWLLRFWSAADAKLYIVFVALFSPLVVSRDGFFLRMCSSRRLFRLASLCFVRCSYGPIKISGSIA